MSARSRVAVAGDAPVIAAYLPALRPPSNPSGPSRSMRSRAFSWRSLIWPRRRSSSRRWPYAALVRGQAEFFSDRRLYARQVQNLALDLGCCERFRAQGLDRQSFAILLPEVFHRAHHYAGFEPELFLGLRQTGFIPGEIGPAGLLPVPGHERLGFVYRSYYGTAPQARAQVARIVYN